MPNKVLIAADENIPFVKEVFSTLGEVRTLAGRAMTAGNIRDADMLLVRSVTKVNEELLAGSRGRFVATATIGTDHVDLDYLEAGGIAFAAAPGSNARSVAEYVAAALLVLESRGFLTLRGATLGIVGVGNVGTRVYAVARALGMKTLWNDPPRARAEGGYSFATLGEVCRRADVVTFHVPLERGGRDPTWHMIGAELLAMLGPGTILLNTSRGAVHDTPAVAAARREGNLAALVLDVWEGEPRVDCDLVALAEIATPHVAGYSYDGKVAGTRMIYEAACRFLGRGPEWPEGLPPREGLEVGLSKPGVLDAVRAAYDIEADDARLREVMRTSSAEERAAGFDRLRKEYPRRREFANWRAVLGKDAGRACKTLVDLGFTVEQA